MTKTKKAPEFELVNVDIETGEEDLLTAGTFEECQAARDAMVIDADDDITHTGDIGYYPTYRIQPFQGW